MQLQNGLILKLKIHISKLLESTEIVRLLTIG